MALSLSRLGDEAGVVFGQLCHALTAFISRAHAAMTPAKLSEDEQRIIFGHLCSVLEPRFAVYFSSASRGLWGATQALRQQLRVEHEGLTATCLKVGIRSKELREAKKIDWRGEHSVSALPVIGVAMALSTLSEDEQHTIFGHWRNVLELRTRELSATDLATLGKLGPVLPSLQQLRVIDSADAAGPDGVQRLAQGLGVGALPAMTSLWIFGVHVGDAGASALAAALGRGALPRLERLHLWYTAITDAGLVALAPALRRRPALETLSLAHNPFGDEGLAALLAPPPLPAGALPPPPGVLTKLQQLCLKDTQVSDAGCAALTAALECGVLPALRRIDGLTNIPASAAARAAVEKALELTLTRVAAERDALYRLPLALSVLALALLAGLVDLPQLIVLVPALLPALVLLAGLGVLALALLQRHLRSL